MAAGDPEPVVAFAPELLADEGEEDRGHEKPGDEDAESDQDAELREAGGLTAQKAQEGGGGGERAEKHALALAADGGGDRAFVIGARLAFPLVHGVEHHAEIDSEPDENRAKADGDHVQFAKDERAEGDGDHATKREDRHDGEQRPDAPEADEKDRGHEQHRADDG
ncbi:MAG: hypothetical protein WDN28_06950 [Chthoniobacter sp.]